MMRAPRGEFTGSSAEAESLALAELDGERDGEQCLRPITAYCGQQPLGLLQARRNCNPDRKPATSAARVTVAPYSSDCRARSSRIERR